jgi:hypothetical protein
LGRVDLCLKDPAVPVASKQVVHAGLWDTDSRIQGQPNRPPRADEGKLLHASGRRVVSKEQGGKMPRGFTPPAAPRRGADGVPAQSAGRAAPVAFTPIESSAGQILHFAKPDAIAYGVAFKPLNTSAWIISPTGDPTKFREPNGNAIFLSNPPYFVTKFPQGTFQNITFKGIKFTSVVTYKPATKQVEAGLGATFNFELPGAIPAIAWLNVRTDNLPPHFTGRLSANIGAALPVDVLTARGLELGAGGFAVIPAGWTQAAAVAMLDISEGIEAAGTVAHEYVGVGYRVQFEFEDGQLVGISRQGKEIDPREFAKDVLNFLLHKEAPPDEQRFVKLGITPHAAHILAQYFIGRDPESFLPKFAAYLNARNPGAHVSTQDIANWINKLGENPKALDTFAAHGMGAIDTSKNRMEPTHLVFRTTNFMQTFADVDRDATAMFGDALRPPGSLWTYKKAVRLQTAEDVRIP